MTLAPVRMTSCSCPPSQSAWCQVGRTGIWRVAVAVGLPSSGLASRPTWQTSCGSSPPARPHAAAGREESVRTGPMVISTARPRPFAAGNYHRAHGRFHGWRGRHRAAHLRLSNQEGDMQRPTICIYACPHRRLHPFLVLTEHAIMGSVTKCTPTCQQDRAAAHLNTSCSNAQGTDSWHLCFTRAAAGSFGSGC